MPRTRALAALLAAAALCAAGRSDDAKPDSDKVAAAIKKLKAADPRLKLKAVEELTPLAADSGPAAAALCDAVASPAKALSLAAFEGVEKARPDLYKPLAALMLDADAANRMQALEGLETLGGRAAPGSACSTPCCGRSCGAGRTPPPAT